MRILAAGGGSGGHVTPAVAVLNELNKQTTLHDVQFVCDKAFAVQAKGIMSHASVPISTHVISAGKLRRYKHFRFWHYIIHPSVVFHNLVDSVKILIGTIQSLRLLRTYKPDVIFLKGGYVCLPVGIAARMRGIPVVIHDSDARPGLTNRIVAPWADRIATGYPVENYPYDPKKCQYTGVPIDESFQKITEDTQRQLKEQLNVSGETPLVVAVGGGLGARSINAAMVDALPQLADIEAYAYVVAGKKNYDEMKAASEQYDNITVLDFVNEGLYTLFGAADVIVCRASATNLQEIAGLGKPVIIVPSRALADQHKNAAVYEEAKAAIVMQDDDLAELGKLGAQLVNLLGDAALREQLARNIHDFARPNAARDVASMIREVAGEGA